MSAVLDVESLLAESLAPGRPVAARDRKPTVLLASPMPTVRESLGTALESHGYRVRLAETGYDVAAWIESEAAFDAAVLDDRLTPTDGLQLAADLHRQSPATAIVLLADRPSLWRRWRAKRTGVAEVLPSRTDGARLISSLRAALSPA
jgi:DNA-binding NtrC family response regulator